MNVLLVFGGNSYEHDVSIITGCVVNNLLKDKYNIFPVYINKYNELYYYKDVDVEDFRNNKKGIKSSFVKKGIKTKFVNYKMDIAIIAMHGLNGEDGMIKGILDFYDIPSIGSNLISSAVNMDKYFSYCVLNENKINVVKSTFITKEKIEHNIEYPVILKPARLGSSIGIKICMDEDEYLDKVFECLKYDKKIVVQEYLEDITELNISLYKNKFDIVCSNIEVVDKHDEIYSYEDKYSKSKIQKRVYLEDDSLSSLIKEMSINTYNILELDGIVRIDYILHNDQIYLNEVNSIPGSLSYYLYDTEFSEIIKELISKEFFELMKKHNLVFDSTILFYDYNMKK